MNKSNFGFVVGLLIGIAFLIGFSNIARADTRVSQGTGFAVTSDGIIATAYHVAHPKSPIGVLVIIVDDKGYPATIIADDRHHDLSLLKVNVPHPLHVARLALPESNQRINKEGYAGYLEGRFLALPGITQKSDFFDSMTYDITMTGQVCAGMSGGDITRDDGAIVGMILARGEADDLTQQAHECGSPSFGNSSQHVLDLLASIGKRSVPNYKFSEMVIILQEIQ